MMNLTGTPSPAATDWGLVKENTMKKCESCTAPIQEGRGSKCQSCGRTVCLVCRDSASCCAGARALAGRSGYIDSARQAGGFKDSPGSTTSSDAAAAQFVDGKIHKDYRRIWDHFQGCGDRGATDHEGAAALGMVKDTFGPRRLEMVTAGLVKDSGRKRPTPNNHPSNVWALCVDAFDPVAIRRVVVANREAAKARKKGGLKAALQARIEELEAEAEVRVGIIFALRNEIAELKDPFDRTTGQGGLF